jgi:hypothetical protein
MKRLSFVFHFLLMNGCLSRERSLTGKKTPVNSEPAWAPLSMSNCLVIFHKQLGDLVLIEPALRLLAETGDNAVDLITRSGFLPLNSLMPYVNFRSKPSVKRYDTLWCFDDRPKSAFFSFLSRARKKRLLVNLVLQFSGTTQRFSPQFSHRISVDPTSPNITGNMLQK